MDYGLTSYKAILRSLLDAGKIFSGYEDNYFQDNVILLRHDIDYTLSWCREIALANAELGVGGNFFMQVRSPLYNLSSFEGRDTLNLLDDCGQNICLHVALPNKHVNKFEVIELISKDMDHLLSLSASAQKVFAWHNPSVWSASQPNYIDDVFEGFINAYGGFASKDIEYVSDSNLRYAATKILDLALKNVGGLQLAMAPIHWASEGNTMRDILASIVVQKLRDMEEEFSTNHIFREKIGKNFRPKFLKQIHDMFRQDYDQV